MIDLGTLNKCKCEANKIPHEMCAGQLVLREKGKSVKLIPKIGEEAVALVLDGCAVPKNQTTCDGVFLLKGTAKKWLLPVELKGTHFCEAFHQLSITINEQVTFNTLKTTFAAGEEQGIYVFGVIVSNAMLNPKDLYKFEREYKVKVKKILISSATKPIPNIRDFL